MLTCTRRDFWQLKPRPRLERHITPWLYGPERKAQAQSQKLKPQRLLASWLLIEGSNMVPPEGIIDCKSDVAQQRTEPDLSSVCAKLSRLWGC